MVVAGEENICDDYKQVSRSSLSLHLTLSFHSPDLLPTPGHLAAYSCIIVPTLRPAKQPLLPHVRHILNDVYKDFNSFEEDLFIEELVVVVEEDGSVGHGAEPDGGQTELSEVPRVRPSREYLGPHPQAVLGEGLLHGGVPGVLVVN